MPFLQTVTKPITNSVEALYVNTKQGSYTLHVAKSITICNLTDTTQQFSYCVCLETDVKPNAGAIFYNLTLDANETISPKDKAIPEGYCIRCFAAGPDLISFVCDIYSL